MDLGLSGKRVLITGASKGIGRAIAEVLAEEGCSLHLASRTEADLARARDEINEKHGVQVTIHPLDLSDGENAKRLAQETEGIDILVNNAGTGRLTDPMELPEEEFRYNMDLMLFGPFQCSREVIPHMRKQGGGRIINISSIFGKQPGGLLDYDTIKAAVIMFTKDL